jgi:hypothetical protein
VAARTDVLVVAAVIIVELVADKIPYVDWRGTPSPRSARRSAR